jgi:prepilin-type N-terminal cleavage/methylation domain-containing protein
MAKKGFTLIELLIVIAIIGILAAIVLVAVDPAKRLAQSRDARRAAEVNSILNAILNYTVDHVGTLPASLLNAASNTPLIIGTANSGCDDTRACAVSIVNTSATTTAVSCANLGADGLVDTYIASMPIDPRGTHLTSGFVYSSAATGYYVEKSDGGRVTVGSCNPELVKSITLQR